MLNKASVDFYRRLKFKMPTWCPKGMLHMRPKKQTNKNTHYFLNVVYFKLNLAYQYNLSVSWPVCCSTFNWQHKLVSLYWRDFRVVSSALVLLYVWPTPLQSIDQAILHEVSEISGFSGKISIQRSYTRFLKYLGSVWQNFHSEMMFWDGWVHLFVYKSSCC